MGCLASVQVAPEKAYDNRQRRLSNFSQLTISSMNETDLKNWRKSLKLPLSEKEVFALTKSWKAVNKALIDTGIGMFLRMFDKRADVKSMFEQFRSVEKRDLGNSQSLESHALLVMNALEESIANMDDPEYLIEMLLVDGKSHRRFENFNQNLFWAIEEPFLAAIKETLGDRLTPSMEKIYRKAIHFILKVLIMGFKADFPAENETESTEQV